MKVLKFGGSSIGTPERMLRVQKIICENQGSVLVVVSALEGITNMLENLAETASARDKKYIDIFRTIKVRHLEFLDQLPSGSFENPVRAALAKYLKELEDIINGVFLLNDLTPKIHDRILSYGELLSANMLTSLIENAGLIDSGKVIRTDNAYGNVRVDFNITNTNIQSAVKDMGDKICIAPGFIASDTRGATTTLGRGGSDYSAAIYAAALHAEVLEIWTDVDGFMTADPGKVPKAFAIEKLSYAEAMELSHFGAKVVYTPTIQPVYKNHIPIHIRNTFNPEARGTYIIDRPDKDGPEMIKGVSSIDDIDMLTLQGPGMVGVKGISSRLFGALAGADVNIILITQASSEYSISFAIDPKETERAVSAIRAEFIREIEQLNVVDIVIERDLSIIAIVGERMKNTPGISATLFTALGRNGISVIATAQGSSELNISLVISKAYLRKALNVIHEDFFLSHFKELHLFLVGVGTVGNSLLKQILQQQAALLDEHLLKINVVGIIRSRKMCFNSEGINLDQYLTALENGEEASMDRFIERIREMNLRNSVFVDCTAEDSLALRYQEILDSFVSVVTANKVACSSEYKLYSDLKRTAKKRNVKFMFETNVGAGLPIISTINDLIRSGDRILRLEAVLSGTLNFIFNELSEKISMSKAIRMAQEAGFSEPDPRIDLSGIDVIRKLLILARESGYTIEREDIDIETFLPSECFEGSLADFWQKVSAFDDDFEKRRKKLVADHKRWRFVATLDNGKGNVGLQAVTANHPAYDLEGSNNIILITTGRYHEQPMVIKGYGAGAEVTAAGVFSDIMRISNV
jgi:aspartokinase/homoserine dehydrogenase 1